MSAHTLITRHNLHTVRNAFLSELSGSLGDLGTLLPLLIALSTPTKANPNAQISLSTTLILTGTYNIGTGLFFGIPLPVQPMKAIAAVAILNDLSPGTVAAAGIFVASCVAFLSITGLLEVVNKWTPVPVVKGIQVGAGLSLVIAAGTKALGELHWTGASWADNKIWLIVIFLSLLVLNTTTKKIPFALLVTVTGIIFAVVLATQAHVALPGLSAWHPYAFVPSSAEWKEGILNAGIGQLPLTTLNSIIAVTALAADLLPEVPTPSVTSIGISVAGMNLLGCWFGCMPVCHGSGGLAAQYRFGARSGASVIILGTIKLVLGLVFGNTLTGLLGRFPVALLTVMIIAAGLELVSVGESLNSPRRARDLKDKDDTRKEVSERESKERWTTMMTTAGVLVAFKNDAVGFLAGLVCHGSFLLRRKIEARQQRRHGEEEREALLPP